MLCDQKLQSIFVAIAEWISAESCGMIVAEEPVRSGKERRKTDGKKPNNPIRIHDAEWRN